jgi:hypothetical protein
MKKLTLSLALFSLFFIPVIAHSESFTTTILDRPVGQTDFSYWGGMANFSSFANVDVIGAPYFNVDEMVVIQDGDIWTVILTGPYFLARQDPNVDNGQPFILDPGDLYISSQGYSAVGVGPHYPTDTFLSTEPWDYVVPILPTGGASGLFALDFGSITMSNVSDLVGNFAYRKNQAWVGGATGSSLGAASFEFIDDSLIFTFDASALDFSLGTVGFHWTMQCGNDVLEGEVPVRDLPVPEPGTLLLLGLGLTGIVAYRKLRS